MTESRGQNSALNSTANPCRLLDMIINSLFLENGITLTLHIIPNRKLDKGSFQMTYNVALRMVGTLNSSNNACFGVWPLGYL